MPSQAAGAADLVRSMRDGDGAGYDIRSLAADGGDKLIAVKTTNGWLCTPFPIPRNEYDFLAPSCCAKTSGD